MGVFLFALAEATLWYATYQSLNLTGEPYCCPFPPTVVGSLVLQIFRQTFARTLLLVVCLGYGIVRPKLMSAEWMAIAIVSFMDVIFLTWIYLAIHSTIRILTEFNQSVKLRMYQQLVFTIGVFAALFALATVVFMLGEWAHASCDAWSSHSISSQTTRSTSPGRGSGPGSSRCSGSHSTSQFLLQCALYANPQVFFVSFLCFGKFYLFVQKTADCCLTRVSCPLKIQVCWSTLCLCLIKGADLQMTRIRTAMSAWCQCAAAASTRRRCPTPTTTTTRMRTRISQTKSGEVPQNRRKTMTLTVCLTQRKKTVD